MYVRILFLVLPVKIGDTVSTTSKINGLTMFHDSLVTDVIATHGLESNQSVAQCPGCLLQLRHVFGLLHHMKAVCKMWFVDCTGRGHNFCLQKSRMPLAGLVYLLIRFLNGDVLRNLRVIQLNLSMHSFQKLCPVCITVIANFFPETLCCFLHAIHLYFTLE